MQETLAGIARERPNLVLPCDATGLAQ
jgi:hypothetical protein